MAQSDVPTPRSQPQILGEMLDGVTSRTGIRRLKIGNPILSILETVSLSTAKSTYDAFKALQAKDLDNINGVALQRAAADEKLSQLGPVAATTNVTVSDTSFTKISSNVSHEASAPIVGSGTISVDKTPTFNTAPATGTIYIGRGTPRSEGPISYTGIADGGNYWVINLTTPTTSFHNWGETVVVGQGGDRPVSLGQSVSTPQGALTNSVQYTVIVGGVIPDGETELTGVLVRCTTAGSIGNVPENTIVAFSGAAPFTGAAVTNPDTVTSGRDTETSQQFRDRIKTTRNTKVAGTDLAITNAVINLTAPDEQKTVLSSSIVRRAFKPSTLYIDDGSGYQPISQGVGYEILRDSATGGETEFQTINSPIVLASVETSNTGPFSISTGSTLEVSVGGNVATHIFDTSVFNNSDVGSPYDVANSINSNTLLTFKARVSSQSTKVTVFPKDDQIDTIQVVGGTANETLQFPVGTSYTTLLYKNDRLASFLSFNLDRANGSIVLAAPLAAGDRLTLGSLWSRGFIESATIGTLNQATSQPLWFALDGNTTVIDSSFGGVGTLTVSITKSLPGSFHATVQNNYNFSSNVAAGQNLLLYQTSNNSLPAALQGVHKIIEVPAANQVVIEIPCMKAARKQSAAANIAGGMILVCGGLCSNGSGILDSAELYNTATGAFTAAAAMTTPRYGHTATTLANGKVLVTGGMGPAGTALATAELYDPTANTWTLTNSLPSPSYLHSAICLTSGSVLVAGGLNGLNPTWTVLAASVEYNPTTNVWEHASTYNVGRYSTTLIGPLTGNKAFMLGGLTAAPDLYLEDTDATANLAKFSVTLTTNMYDAAAHSWSSTAVIPDASAVTAYRNYTGATIASDTIVAVADDHYYTYVTTTDTWTSRGTIAQTPEFAAGQTIYNGTSSLNQTRAQSTTAFSSLGRANPIMNTGSVTLLPFAELTTSGVKSFVHLKYDTADNLWKKTGFTGNVTVSGGRSFWSYTTGTNNAWIFGGQQGVLSNNIRDAASWTMESDVVATVENVDGVANTSSYLSPVTGTYAGVQGWVVYNTSAPTQTVTVPSNSGYIADSLASAITISGATTKTYRSSKVRVSSNDNAGEIVLLGPTVAGIQNEVAQASSPNTSATVKSSTTELTNPFDFRLYQIGEAVGSTYKVPGQQIANQTGLPQTVGGYLPLNGTLCGLIKKNFWEDALQVTPTNWPSHVQDSANSGREWGNFKNEIAHILSSNTLATISLGGNITAPDCSVVTTDGTVSITPNQAVYCGAPYGFSWTDKLSATIDNDTFSGAFSVPMARKVKSANNNYASLITISDAENANLPLGKKFGINYDFSNFYVAMKARAKIGNILYRFYRPGAEGENYVIRYEYPSVPNASLAVSVDHNWSHAGLSLDGHVQKSHINVTLPSGAKYTNSVINSTTKVAIVEAPLTTATMTSDLYLMVGFTVTQAERTSIGGPTRLRIQYPSTAAIPTTPLFAIGDFIRFDATTPIPTTLLSGQAQIASVSTPVTNYQDITIVPLALDDGTSAMSLATNPGFISLDPAATTKTQFDPAIVVNDLVSLNIPTANLSNTLYSTLMNQGFRISAVDANKQWLKCMIRDQEAANMFQYGAINDPNYISIFHGAVTSETAIVSSVNAFANTPVTATLLSAAANVNLASWDYANNWDAGFPMTDGLNAVLSTVNPGDVNTDYQINLKKPINSSLSSSADFINDDIYLIPAYASDVVAWLNTPCITGLWSMAAVETADSGMSVQVTSLTSTKNSAVQISGVGANEAAAPVVGQTAMPNNLTPTSYPNFVVSIDTANAAGFTGNSMVKISNSVAMQKQYVPMTVVDIAKDGTFTFASAGPYTAGAKVTTTGSVEKVGDFAVIRLNTVLQDAWPTGKTVPGDFIYLTGPTYDAGAFTSLLGNLSNSNKGVFRIINVSHNNTVIWVENPGAVTEKAVMDATLLTSQSIIPGDILTITDNSWGVNNKGSWTVESVGKSLTEDVQFVNGTLKVDVSKKSIYPITSPLLMSNATVQAVEGTPRTFYKKLIGINPNQTDPNQTDLVLCSNNHTATPDLDLELTAISATAGSVISSMNKLSFPTDIKVGADAYRYNTGLIGEAKKVIYGDPNDSATYPGVVSNGASVLVDGPAIKRVSIAFSVRAIGNPSTDLADKIKSVIAGVINSNNVGQNLSISDLTTAGGAVDGVDSISALYSQGDQIKVSGDEKTMVISSDDVSIIFTED